MRFRIQPISLTCQQSKDPKGDHVRLYYLASTADGDWGHSAVSGPTWDRRLFCRATKGGPPATHDLTKVATRAGSWPGALEYDGGYGMLHLSFVGIHAPVDVPEEEDWIGGGGAQGSLDRIDQLLGSFSLAKSSYEFAAATAELSTEVARAGKVLGALLGKTTKVFVWVSAIVSIMQAIIDLLTGPDCRGVAFKTIRFPINEGDIALNLVKNDGVWVRRIPLDAASSEGCQDAEYYVDVLFTALERLEVERSAPVPLRSTKGSEFTFTPGAGLCNLDGSSFNAWSIDTAHEYGWRATQFPGKPIHWSIGGQELPHGSGEIEVLVDLIRAPFRASSSELVRLEYHTTPGTDRDFSTLTIRTGSLADGVFTPGQFEVAVAARVESIDEPFYEATLVVDGHEQTGDALYQEYVACQSQMTATLSRWVDYQPFLERLTDPIGPRGPRPPEVRPELQGLELPPG